MTEPTKYYNLEQSQKLENKLIFWWADINQTNAEIIEFFTEVKHK